MRLKQLLTEVEALLAEATDKSVGVFIPVPRSVAKSWPKFSDEDTSPPHITILYIGELERSDFETVVATVREFARSFAPFEIEMTDYGEFKNDKGQTIPHMIPRASELEKLHYGLRDALELAGVDVQHHEGPFKNHATLGYLEPGESYTGPRPEATWTVSEIEVWGSEDEKIRLGTE